MYSNGYKVIYFGLFYYANCKLAYYKIYNDDPCFKIKCSKCYGVKKYCIFVPKDFTKIDYREITNVL